MAGVTGCDRVPIRTVIFDLGNVLVTVDEIGAARQIAEVARVPLTTVRDAVFSPRAKRGIETGAQTWEEFAARAIDRLKGRLTASSLREIYDSALVPNPSITPVVNELSRRVRLGLCSNTSETHWLHARAMLPFSGILDPTILSYETGVSKPDPRIFEHLVRAVGGRPDAILFIDDLAANVAGARDCGLASIQFTGVAALRRQLRRLGIL